MILLGVYAPEEGKQELSNEFYETLQKAVQRAEPLEDLFIVGDLNAQVGAKKIGKCAGSFGVGTINTNGKQLIDFCAFHNLRILNTLFPHKMSHKYTWSSRDSSSMIDFVIAGEETAKRCTDTRVFRGNILDLTTTCYRVSPVVIWLQELRDDRTQS